MILHIFPDEKFTLDFIYRTEALFDINEHCFWIYGCRKNRENYEEYYYEYINRPNFIFLDYNRNTVKLFEEKLKEAKIVIVHYLFDARMLNSINKYVTMKGKIFVWVIWGYDLYNIYDFHHSLRILWHPKAVFFEYLRKKFIRHVKYVVTCDYDVLKKRYKTDAKCLDASYSYEIVDVKEVTGNNERIRVLVGNSATNTCRHIETFNKLSKYKDKISVVCPLSYPKKNKLYINKVIKAGKEIFGKHFEPITDFMSYSDYVNLLNSIDVGIFNTSRQQGNGNIINLILLGKKVYMSKDNTLSAIYSPQEGYYTFRVEELDENMLQPLTKEQAENNHKKILYLLSDEYFRESWDVIYKLRN